MDNNEEKQEAKTGYEVAEEITNQIVSNLSPEDIDKLGIQMVNLFVSFSVMEKTTKDPDALAKIAYSIDILRTSIAHALGGRCFDIQFDEDEVKPDDEAKTEAEDETEDDASSDDEELEEYRESQNLTRENARRAVSLMSDVEVSNLATQLVSIFIETSQMKNLAKNALHAATFKFVNKLVKLNIRIALNGRRLSVLEPQNCRTLVVSEDQEDKKGDKNNE